MPLTSYAAFKAIAFLLAATASISANLISRWCCSAALAFSDLTASCSYSSISISRAPGSFPSPMPTSKADEKRRVIGNRTPPLKLIHLSCRDLLVLFLRLPLYPLFSPAPGSSSLTSELSHMINFRHLSFFVNFFFFFFFFFLICPKRV